VLYFVIALAKAVSEVENWDGHVPESHERVHQSSHPQAVKIFEWFHQIAWTKKQKVQPGLSGKRQIAVDGYSFHPSL